VNRVIPGALAPTGAGFVTGGAMAQEAEAMSLGQWALSGFSGSTTAAGTFTSLETGAIAGSVAIVNTVVVGAVWEAGVVIGSGIAAIFR